MKVTVGDLVNLYSDNEEEGVIGYGGKLDIRPAYQREFIYEPKQRDAVINTVMEGFPLNVMYWAVREDGSFEVLDGQQRTIALCKYKNGDFSYKGLSFHNQPADVQDRILDYELMVYRCQGTDSEKLDWFRIVNIAGERLLEQELLNAIYTGPWLSDAKRYFSKTGCAAYGLGNDYMKGAAIRQEYLETVLSWKSGGDIEKYMDEHRQDPTAWELWSYFQSVISWVESLFRVKNRYMKGREWGEFYNEFKDKVLDPLETEEKIKRLMLDQDVTKKSGIYAYILSGKEKHLSIRPFPDEIRILVYEQQGGVCKMCGKPFSIGEMEADHIKPWSEGGKTEQVNCQMLCREDNRRKGAK